MQSCGRSSLLLVVGSMRRVTRLAPCRGVATLSCRVAPPHGVTAPQPYARFSHAVRGWRYALRHPTSAMLGRRDSVSWRRSASPPPTRPAPRSRESRPGYAYHAHGPVCAAAEKRDAAGSAGGVGVLPGSPRGRSSPRACRASALAPSRATGDRGTGGPGDGALRARYCALGSVHCGNYGAARGCPCDFLF